MTEAEIIAGRVADTMAEVRQRIREFCGAEGVTITEADLERMTEPLRYQVAAMHTDGVEAVRGRH